MGRTVNLNRSRMDTIDILNINGCVVRDEDTGTDLAIVHENGRKVSVERLAPCSIGSYFYILYYLRELGFDTE